MGCLELSLLYIKIIFILVTKFLSFFLIIGLWSPNGKLSFFITEIYLSRNRTFVSSLAYLPSSLLRVKTVRFEQWKLWQSARNVGDQASLVDQAQLLRPSPSSAPLPHGVSRHLILKRCNPMFFSLTATPNGYYISISSASSRSLLRLSNAAWPT